jgi:hypothetical protein
MKKMTAVAVTGAVTAVTATGLFAYWMIGVIAEAMEGAGEDWDEGAWTLEDWAEWWGADDEE